MVSTSSDGIVAVDHKKSFPFLHRYHLLLKLHYFLFFSGFGAIYPIASITLSSRGLTTLEISYINLIIPFLIFITNPFSGLLADRSGRFRLTFNIALCLTLIFYGILFILPSIKTYNISGKMYQINQLEHTLNFCANEELAVKCASRSECGCTYQANCRLLTRRNHLNENNRSNILKFNFSMNSKYVEKERKNISTHSKQSSLCTIDYRVSINQSLAKYTNNGSHRSSLNGNSHLANCEIRCTVAHFCHGSRYSGQIVYILLYSLAFIIGGSLFTNCVTIGTSIGFAVLPRQDLFGRQRVWGTIGSGISAVIASRLYEHFQTEYVYIYMFIATSVLTVIVTSFLRIRSHQDQHSEEDGVETSVLEESNGLSIKPISEETKAKKKPALNLGTLIPLMKKIDVLIFLSLTFIWGISYAPLDPYLFLYIDEVAGCQSHSIIGWMTLISAMSEVVAFFLAHQLLKRLGTNISSILIMLAFAIRFSGYYFIRRPYFILPMETMHFFNSGILFVLIAQKANTIAPSGLSVTLQGIAYGICYGLGRGIGLVISLFLYTRLEKRRLFLIAAIFNLVAAIIYSLYFLFTKQCSLPSTDYKNTSNDVIKSIVLKQDGHVNEEPLLSSSIKTKNNRKE